MQKKNSPLVDVALNYLKEVSVNQSPNDIEFIKDCFSKYIYGLIPFEVMCESLSRFVKSTAPFERLKAILDCENDPIPENTEIETERMPNARKKTRSWTANEDARLLYAIHKFGIENWGAVSTFVGNGRTCSMCSQRWIRVLDPKICKGHWLPEEERRLVQLVVKHGEKNWMKVSAQLGNRSDVQCRYRYMQLRKSGKINRLFQIQPNVIPQIYDMSNRMPPREQAQPLEQIPNFNQFEVPKPNINVQPPQAPVIPQISTQKMNEIQFRLEEQIQLANSWDFFKSDPFFDVEWF
ncbi:Myb-like DNA-binding domain containing protein [Histomonas meleagridis]|uniref:Myb-like DNA-binding domain containing protein n=1 Tax=Histomonas meleagridis TaxID=135588 RepID=UPI00355A063E|nr:Myb-like DNA-binding domain containing protein [Histomonas meleagridis]KAH0797638.1 Myb-like DNA-binding domain containing protein [Histomonas meleagridis]